MKSTVKTVKGRGRPLGSKNKTKTISLTSSLTALDQLERDLERKDHTLEIMRDEIVELEKQIKDILTSLRQEKGYDYILNYGPGTGVLMVNEAHDVTGLVLEKLNKDKKATGQKPAAK